MSEGYRTAPAREGATEIRWGPFRLQWGALGLAVVFTAVGAGFSLAAIGADSLDCVRSGDGTTICTAYQDMLVGRAFERHIDMRNVAEARFAPYEGSKGADLGRTEMLDTRGSPITVLDGDRDEAERVHRALAAFLGRDAPERFRESMSRSILGLVVGLVFFVVGIAGLGRILPPATSVRIRVDRRAGHIEARPSRLGVPRRTTIVDAATARSVEIERGTISRFMQSRTQTPILASRLVVVDRDGKRSPLLPWKLPGTDVHDRAAAELERALGLVVSDREPAPAVDPVPRPRTAWRPIFAVLLAVAVLGAGAFAFQELVMRDSSQGTLDVRSEHRCRFDGAEILPGGAFQMMLDPGVYPIDLYAPSEPGGWHPDRVRVNAGETTRYVCTTPPGTP